MKGNLPRPGAWQAKEMTRLRLLRNRRATPSAVRATFADDGGAVDVAEKPETGADAASVRSAARFEANLVVKYAVKYEMKYVVRYVPKYETTRVVKSEASPGVK